MLTESQKSDIAECYLKGLDEMKALEFIMTKYCRCELPAYNPRETVYNYIVSYYSEKRNIIGE